MSRKYIIVSVELPDDALAVEASEWMAAVLETAFTKPNPAPRPTGMDGVVWKSRIPMPASEHPYKPQVVGTSEDMP